MRFHYGSVALFFLAIVGLAALLFPTYFDVALIHRNSYLYSTALVMLEDLDRQSQNARVDLERARVLYLVGRYDDSVEVLQNVTAREPRNLDAWRQLAETHRTLQRHEEAISAYENLLSAAPADSQALYMLDDYYRWFQRTDAALGTLERIVELYPQDMDSQERLVDLYLRTDRGDEAAQRLERLADTSDDAADALADLGNLYLVRRDPRAVDLYDRLQDRLPGRDDIVDGLVSALAMTGAHADALRRFEAHYSERLTPATYARRRALLRLTMGDRSGAAADFQSAYGYDPEIGVTRDLAELYADMGQHGLAAIWAARLVDEQPSVTSAWSLWIACLATAQIRPELIAALEAYLQRWPRDDDMRLELADAYQWVQDYEAEAATLARLLESRPGDPMLRSRLAMARVSAGQPQEALPLFAGLLSDDPANAPRHVQGLLEAAPRLPPTAASCAHLVRAAGHLPVLSADVVLQLAAALDRCGANGTADAVYAHASDRVAGQSGALARLGQQLAESGRADAARARLRQALAIDADNETALSSLAGLLAASQPAQARALLLRLHDARPADGDVAYRLGLMHEALGDTTAMVRAYRHALAALPDTAGSAYGARRRAHALAMTGSRADALTLLDEARRRFPGDYGLVNDGANLLLAAGRHEEALLWLAQVPQP